MPLVPTEDLIDAHEVARIIGSAQRNSVSLYLHKYPDMPRPVVDLGPSRPRLWLRPEIETWVQHRQPVTRGRPRKSVTTPAAQPATLPADKAPHLGGLRQGGVAKPNDPNRTVQAAGNSGALGRRSTPAPPRATPTPGWAQRRCGRPFGRTEIQKTLWPRSASDITRRV